LIFIIVTWLFASEQTLTFSEITILYFRQKILSIYKLAGFVLLSVFISACEGLPMYFYAEEGPDMERLEKETRILYTFMNWNLSTDRPTFLVASLVSF
jgi:hypothetical protein